MYRVLATILIITAKPTTQTSRDQIFHVPLNADGSISFNWLLDYPNEMVTFEIHIPASYGWFAVGFSDHGEHFPADYCLLWKDMKSRVHFEDVWADTGGMIHLDRQQDCGRFRVKRVRNTTKFTFQRKFDTCDFEDYVIEDGTTHVVWARSADPLYKPTGLNISSPGEDKGMVRVQLLKNTNVEASLPGYVQSKDILAEGVKVPADETTYWCHVHKLDEEFRKKHHVYRVGLTVLVFFGFLLCGFSTKPTFREAVRVWCTTWKSFTVWHLQMRKFRYT